MVARELTPGEGRAFAILPRSYAPRGYLDINFDDYDEGTLLGKLQASAGGGNHRSSVSPGFGTVEVGIADAMRSDR